MIVSIRVSEREDICGEVGGAVHTGYGLGMEEGRGLVLCVLGTVEILTNRMRLVR